MSYLAFLYMLCYVTITPKVGVADSLQNHQFTVVGVGDTIVDLHFSDGSRPAGNVTARLKSSYD